MRKKFVLKMKRFNRKIELILQTEGNNEIKEKNVFQLMRIASFRNKNKRNK